MYIDIFVSRPNSVDENQDQTMQKIEELLNGRGMRARTIGKTDFPNVAPMKAVEHLMRQCSGAVIIGLPQTLIQKGISKPGTSKQKPVKNLLLPTPWNHIEAAMAFMLNLPLLVIRDQGIEGGIFDKGATEKYIHTFQLDTQEWLGKPDFIQPFNDWHKEVVESLKVSKIN
ncbi:hypothetical protein J7E63_11085 [Bacillus sp. ISL-75]|uniref:hypothetical protein n=1 Tax=Bacillus sp. ISL-75 TaxID=2819137 RepID=UPI001BECC63D|nr:hypothetical protein [Bacillus sp. ISL-75]MBT2727478.1 hypothetical protein [Bacillus sp. ISL-75]